MKKPHITPIRMPCTWPGAMSFRINLPGGIVKYLTVDTWGKLNWYLAKWRLAPNWPAGIDLG